MGQPIILVASTSGRDARPYRESLERRGAQVRLALPDLVIPSGDPLNGATGLLLTGGEDVDPHIYGESPDPAAGLETNRLRDDMELVLLGHAMARDLPVLAICRGMQLLNVAFGGKLVQDLPNHKAKVENGTSEVAYHQIYLSPGTKLAAIMGSGGFLNVNSLHHQGLREAHKSSALLASAYSMGDGLIEGLESPAHDWVLGVQCHPEREAEVPKSFGRLFQAFVERAEMADERRGAETVG